jgi:cobalt-precorrin-7 (C5)-methyltransferase
MVYIVGIGPGAKEYILPKALEILNISQIVIGFERAINSVEHKNKLVIKSLTETLAYLDKSKEENIAIVASGDPCFYGITDYINKNFEGNVEVIPGISSFQYLMAKLNKSWQGATLGSLHGRKEEFLEKVKTNKLSIWLTDKDNSPNFICSELIKNNIKAQVCVGVNLSYEDELVLQGTAEEVSLMEFHDLSVVVIETSQ